MNRFLIAACLTILCVAQAFAVDDPMEDLFGNTIVSSGGRCGSARTITPITASTSPAR